MANSPNLLGYLEHHSPTSDGSFSICIAGGIGSFVSKVRIRRHSANWNLITPSRSGPLGVNSREGPSCTRRDPGWRQSSNPLQPDDSNRKRHVPVSPHEPRDWRTRALRPPRPRPPWSILQHVHRRTRRWCSGKYALWRTGGQATSHHLQMSGGCM